MNAMEYAIELHRQAKENGLPYDFDHCLRLAIEQARHFRAVAAKQAARATA